MKKINSRELDILKVVSLVHQLQCQRFRYESHCNDDFLVEFDSCPFNSVDDRCRYRVAVYFRDDVYWTAVVEECRGEFTPIEIIQQFEPSIYERKSK